MSQKLLPRFLPSLQIANKCVVQPVIHGGVDGELIRTIGPFLVDGFMLLVRELRHQVTEDAFCFDILAAVEIRHFFVVEEPSPQTGYIPILIDLAIRFRNGWHVCRASAFNSGPAAIVNITAVGNIRADPVSGRASTGLLASVLVLQHLLLAAQAFHLDK